MKTYHFVINGRSSFWFEGTLTAFHFDAAVSLIMTVRSSLQSVTLEEIRVVLIEEVGTAEKATVEKA